jgi:hypothetical protein
MKKQNYQSPKLSLVYVHMEESIAAGSYTNSIDITTEGGGVRIGEYDIYEEGNKDFNINL